jgi:hypothetical protein
MVDFEYFILKGDVKKQVKDERLANLLIKESFDRLEFVKSLKLDEKNAKYIVENIYDILRELIEAKLALNGFKSYSHEATILFLKKFPEFKESEIRFMDNLRKIRNGIKYYGKDIKINETRKVIDFSRFILPKLKSLVKK